MAGTEKRLEIYVANHSDGCREARRIAELARAAPDLEVGVIDVDQVIAPIPRKVEVVRTYVLDARVVSMRNPDPLAFVTFLERQTEGANP